MRANSRKRKNQPRPGNPGKRQKAATRRRRSALETERQRRRQAEREVQKLRKVERTKKRSTRELADTVLQGLYAVGLGLEASRTLLHVSPQRAGQALTRATDQLNGLIQRLRAYLTPVER